MERADYTRPGLSLLANSNNLIRQRPDFGSALIRPPCRVRAVTSIMLINEIIHTTTCIVVRELFIEGRNNS